MQEEAKKIVKLNLERLLAKTRMSQTDLAERSGIPISTINGYVKGTSLPTPGNTEKISRVFNVGKEEIDPRFNEDSFKNFDFDEAKNKLNKDENEFFEALIEKALSLGESEREDFFENIRFAVEFFNKQKK